MKNDGAFVAIKKIRIQTSAEEGMPMSTIREIAMLKQLENFEHPNIVRYVIIPSRVSGRGYKIGPVCVCVCLSVSWHSHGRTV